MRKTASTILILMAILLCAASSTFDPQDVDEKKATALRAALIAKIGPFVQWPEKFLANETEPVIIGVLGKDPFGITLERAIANLTIHGRKIQIKRFQIEKNTKSDDEYGKIDQQQKDKLAECHILYVSQSEKGRLKAIINLLDDSPVLTISDSQNFAIKGGMVELVLKKGRYTLTINREAAEDTSLKLSSKLLSLATIVKTEDSGP